jgi:hypothetical protein
MGTQIAAISIRKPHKHETTLDIIAQWSRDTHFILPRTTVANCITLVRFPTTLSLGDLSVEAWCLEILHSALRRIGGHPVTMLATHLSGISYSITFHGWLYSSTRSSPE